jgi:hypothetical protein
LGTIISIPSAVDLHKEKVKIPPVSIINDLIQEDGRAQPIPYDPYSPPFMNRDDAAAGNETEYEHHFKGI